MRDDDLGRDDVQNFYCGDEPWAVPLATYITSGQAWQEHKPPKSATLLYFSNENEEDFIGYYNISKYNPRYPDFYGERRVPCYLITWLAIASQFQGQGFLSAMIRDVAISAIQSDLVAVYLFVDDRNEKAMRRYLRLGFRFHEKSPPHEEDGASYNRMILPLR